MAAETAIKYLTRASAGKLPKKPVPTVDSEFPEDEPAAMTPVHINIASELKTQALAIPIEAKTIIVKDQGSLTAANDFLAEVKRMGQRIAETFDPQIYQAHKLHRSLIDEKKKFTDPLDLAEKLVKPKIAAYLADQQRIKREAEEARARAEEEARKLAEKAVAKADKLEEKGESGKATEVIEQAFAKVEAITSAAPVIPDDPETNGLSLRKEWKFIITDVKLIPREYMIPNEVKIRQVVRALKDEAKIPGVRVYSEDTVSQRLT